MSTTRDQTLNDFEMSSLKQATNLYRQWFQLRGFPLARGSAVFSCAPSRQYSVTASPVAQGDKYPNPKLRYEDMYNRLLQVYTGTNGTISVQGFQAVSLQKENI